MENEKINFTFKKKETEKRQVFSVALKKSLYDKLKSKSQEIEISMGEMVAQLLEAALE